MWNILPLEARIRIIRAARFHLPRRGVSFVKLASQFRREDVRSGHFLRRRHAPDMLLVSKRERKRLLKHRGRVFAHVVIVLATAHVRCLRAIRNFVTVMEVRVASKVVPQEFNRCYRIRG